MSAVSSLNDLYFVFVVGLTSDGAQVPVNVRCHIYIPPCEYTKLNHLR